MTCGVRLGVGDKGELRDFEAEEKKPAGKHVSRDIREKSRMMKSSPRRKQGLPLETSKAPRALGRRTTTNDMRAFLFQ